MVIMSPPLGDGGGVGGGGGVVNCFQSGYLIGIGVCMSVSGVCMISLEPAGGFSSNIKVYYLVGTSFRAD